MLIICILIALCTLGLNGEKLQMHIFFEEVEMETIDPEYFDPESTYRFVSEENTIGTNWTIVKTFPPETNATIQTWQYSMGAYTIPTGTKMEWLFCVFIDNVMAKEYFTSLDITNETCPPEPGNYFLGSHVPAAENLPTGIPDAKYLVVSEIAIEKRILYKDEIYLETQTY